MVSGNAKARPGPDIPGNRTGRRLVSANDQKRTTERERSGSPPKPPDIPVLARLGGLPGNIIPYRLRALRSNLVVSASGNDTCTVNQCVALGFASRIDDARQVHLQFGQTLRAAEVKYVVEDLDWVEDEWVESNLLAPKEVDTDKLGIELRDRLVARVPVLQEWVNLPENIRRGQIIEALYRQMTEVARIVVKRSKTFTQARELTPHFTTLWPRFDALDVSMKTQFADVESWGPRRRDLRLPRRDDVLDTIGLAFFGGRGWHEMERSMKAFRRWRQCRNESVPK
jgi:hypothetical protein